MTTSTTDVTVKASTPRRVRALSPAQSAAIQQTAGLSIAFAALPMTLKNGWQAAANVQNAREGRTGRQKLSAANMYVSVNSMRLACSLEETDTAPTDFALPGKIPPVSVTVTGGPVPFSVTLFCAGYDTAAVSVEAANGVAAGKSSTADSAYAALTVLTDGLGTTTSLTDEYAAVWGAQEVGAQIAFRLTAINAAGLRGVPYERVGVVTATSATGAGDTEPDMVLDAA